MYISKKYNNKYLNISEFKRNELNKEFIDKKLIEFKPYFDNLFKGVDDNVMLDDEQRIAILTDEDYNMIIAGAGSGKTTTVTAKIKYLVEIQDINPKDILVISFTNKAVEELKERINKDFKINCLITTFHKFGLILLNNKNLKVVNNGYEIVKIYIEDTLCNNNDLLKQFIKKFKNYFRIPFISLFFKSFNNYYNFISKFKFLKIKNKDYYYKDFINFCINIISNMKIRNYTFSDEDIFTDFINKLLQFYNIKLKENNYLDFEDIINQATLCLDGKKLNYKYIIVDEYQDISMQRFKFLKKVSDISNAKVIVVGDDFQTIYNFSGSDINLFTNFIDLFGYASISKITHTYRNSQQLIDIAGNFVMKNENQIKKQLISNKSLYDCLEVVLYKNNRVSKLNYCLKDIIDKFGVNQKILLLGRYSFDINEFLGYHFLLKDNKIKSVKYPNLDITFLTVHSSKGLGFDQVIILNCNDGVYGFPSKIEDNIYIKAMNNNNQIEEERRLFYVALTRTKNKLYILADKNKQSHFINEILRDKDI